MRVTARWLTLFLVLLCGTSCGYLDQDLFTDEETFEESFSTGGLSLSGVGISSGCGGMGFLARRRARVRYRMGGLASLQLEAMHISAMSDHDILENTDIGIIDETASPPEEPETAASLPAQAYYEQLENRNRAIAETY